MITGRDSEFRETIAFFYMKNFGRAVDPVGMEGWLEALRSGMTGPELDAALRDSPEGLAYQTRPATALPAPVSALHLEIHGRHFVNAEGNRIVLNGTDQFMAFRQFLDGGDLTPLLTESQELDFRMWRVFLMGSIRQNSILQLSPAEPDYYVKLRPFADLLNAHGIVLLATVFVDAQDIMADVRARQTHWGHVADALRGTQTLLSGGNEWGKNGWNPGELTDPGMLWSRGSDLSDKAPYKPFASFAEFHPVRGIARTLMDAVASPVFIHDTLGLAGPLVIDEPLGFADADQPGRRSADPFVAWQLGRLYGTMNGGACFHNDNGMRGQLMTPTIRRCAEAWCRGMRL